MKTRWLLLLLFSIGILLYTGNIFYTRNTETSPPIAKTIQPDQSRQENTNTSAQPKLQDTIEPSSHNEEISVEQNETKEIRIMPPSEDSLQKKLPQKASELPPQTTEDPEGINGFFIPLSKLDCENSCEHFSNATKRKYCEEYCGIAPLGDNNTECSKLDNLEKDYCYKHQAVQKQDFSLCEQINDTNIQESCENRVIEEIIDQTQG